MEYQSTKRPYKAAPDADKILDAVAACENDAIVGVDLKTISSRFRRSPSTVARVLLALIAAGRVTKAIYGYVLTPAERARRAQGDHDARS